ncbi:MAG: chlorite dismutase family protein [Candidatus Omnitrophica bacterium]|nr:chlorite dismutase family protein [Candidatus Omnitrophota bacterium]
MEQTTKGSHSPQAVSGEALDIQEYGATKQGIRQVSNRRLYCQLLVFTGFRSEPRKLVHILEDSRAEAVLYADINDPQGIALLSFAEDPAGFAQQTRTLLTEELFAGLSLRSEMTMLGRTYSSGFEQDLEDWLMRRPRRCALDPTWPWAVWYPLRRKSEFELLSKDDQRRILMEHGSMGRRFAEAGHVQDIRLACHGLDARDNEFVIGLLGKELYPISRLVQEMRKTEQTSKYIQSLGPFFVGHVIWQGCIQKK